VTPIVFNEALADPEVSNINLSSSTIQLSAVTSVDRPVTFTNGTLEFSQQGQALVLLDGGTLDNVTVNCTSPSEEWTEGFYGVQFYTGTAGTVRNCTFNGGNAGILVNGTTVTLEGTTTISNTQFGGIEVSKGSGVTNPSILIVNGTIVNDGEEYAKPTVWVDGTSSDVGQVVDNSGILTEATVNNQLQYYLDALNSYPTWTDVSEYTSATDDGAYDGKDVVLKLDGLNYSNQSVALSQQQNRENPPKLHLIVTNSTFNGGTELGKQIYVTNIQSMLLENDQFIGSTISDYGVDVNLCTIQNSNIQIKNCTFSNTGTKAALKISQRKGSTDHPTDITVTTPATIENVLIERCSFSGNVVDYNVGTTPKGEDTDANTTTGAYPITIENCTTNVVVAEPYLVDKDVEAPKTTLLAGTTATKTADGQFYVEQ
jgi:hypothetical protein